MVNLISDPMVIYCKETWQAGDDHFGTSVKMKGKNSIDPSHAGSWKEVWVRYKGKKAKYEVNPGICWCKADVEMFVEQAQSDEDRLLLMPQFKNSIEQEQHARRLKKWKAEVKEKAMAEQEALTPTQEIEKKFEERKLKRKESKIRPLHMTKEEWNKLNNLSSD